MKGPAQTRRLKRCKTTTNNMAVFVKERLQTCFCISLLFCICNNTALFKYPPGCFVSFCFPFLFEIALHLFVDVLCFFEVTFRVTLIPIPEFENASDTNKNAGIGISKYPCPAQI